MEPAHRTAAAGTLALGFGLSLLRLLVVVRGFWVTRVPGCCSFKVKTPVCCVREAASPAHSLSHSFSTICIAIVADGGCVSGWGTAGVVQSLHSTWWLSPPLLPRAVLESPRTS
jgi:hypothetical protein